MTFSKRENLLRNIYKKQGGNFMETNRTVEIKNSRDMITVFYKNHEVWINRVDLKNDIAEILDLQTCETYVVHCKKLLEGVSIDSCNSCAQPLLKFI